MHKIQVVPSWLGNLILITFNLLQSNKSDEYKIILVQVRSLKEFLIFISNSFLTSLVFLEKGAMLSSLGERESCPFFSYGVGIGGAVA